jgi:hypothetical protein
MAATIRLLIIAVLFAAAFLVSLQASAQSAQGAAPARAAHSPVHRARRAPSHRGLALDQSRRRTPIHGTFAGPRR